MLFSATRGGKVEKLVSETLGENHKEIDIMMHRAKKLNDNVLQGKMCCRVRGSVVVQSEAE